jgi:hypothetical protein
MGGVHTPRKDSNDWMVQKNFSREAFILQYDSTRHSFIFKCISVKSEINNDDDEKECHFFVLMLLFNKVVPKIVIMFID